jgi:ABC-type multidrug transport system permease subunit
MKCILDIGHNDLRLFLKHRSAYVWLFVMPLAFVYFMGFANRGPGDPANRKPEVLVENLDTNFLGRLFLEELGAQGLWLMDPTNRETAARGIRIPADFTGKVLQREQARVQFFRRQDSAEADAAIIEMRLVRALIAMNGHILEAVTRTNPPAGLDEHKLREVMAEPDPVNLKARFAGRKPVPSGFNFSLPGNLVMYLMMNLLLFGGATVAAERRNGVIKRLMVCPVTRNELVMGKVYGLMLLGSVQILFFLAVGRFVFHVNLGANLPGVTLTLLVFAWVAGSLGILAGSLLAAEDRVAGVCVLASLIMAALGGCWWPLEVGPPWLKLVALCLPTGWALEALHQLISFGSGLGAVLKPIAVLLLFGAAANWLAARFFRN